MADTAFVAGATSKIVTVEAIVISTGLPYTSGAYNTSGISATYTRLGSTPTTLTLVTATAGTYTSSGFVHRGKGVYEIGAPTAALAAGADAVEFAVDGITDVLFRPCRVELTGQDPRAARSDSNVTYWNGNAVATPNTNGVPKVDVTHILGTAGATTELSAIPSATASFWDRISFLFMRGRNKMTQTSSTTTLYKDDGTTSVGTSTVSDDGTTFTRGKAS